MIDFIQYIVLGCLWCYGVYAVFDNDHLLGKFGDWIERNTSTFYIRPIFGCPPCMASFHGSIIGIMIYDFRPIVIIYVICLCGINYIIKNLIFKE